METLRNRLEIAKSKYEEIINSATYRLYIKKGISQEKSIQMILDVENDCKENNWIVLN